MLQKILSLMLIGLVLNLAFYPTNIKANQIQDDKDAKLAEKVKTKLKKLGVNEKITVKLKDGKKIKGYISELENDYFVVTNQKDKNLTDKIQYLEVKEVKGPDDSFLFWGRNSPKRAWVGTIVVLTIFGVLVARRGL